MIKYTVIALQCWYKIQKSDDENSLINQHEGVILIWHQILSDTLQRNLWQIEVRLMNHNLAVEGQQVLFKLRVLA